MQTRGAKDDAGPGEEAQAQAPREAADDDALILWMLGLDAERRLEAAQGFVDGVEAMRHGRRG